MAADRKPAEKSLDEVDKLLGEGKTLEEIEAEHPKLKAAVLYRRSHSRARPGGASPVTTRWRLNPVEV